MDSNLRDAILKLFAAEGWERLEEIDGDPTPDEIEELDDHGAFERDGRRVVSVGQTDANGNTYAFEEPIDDGDILIAPYMAGTVWPKDEPESIRQTALRELASVAFAEVPDTYCQCIAFRI